MLFFFLQQFKEYSFHLDGVSADYSKHIFYYLNLSLDKSRIIASYRYVQRIRLSRFINASVTFSAKYPQIHRSPLTTIFASVALNIILVWKINNNNVYK